MSPVTINDPTAATPVEIDTELARIALDRARAERDLAGLVNRTTRLAELGNNSAADRLQPLIDNTRQKVSDCDATARPLNDEFVRRAAGPAPFWSPTPAVTCTAP